MLLLRYSGDCELHQWGYWIKNINTVPHHAACGVPITKYLGSQLDFDIINPCLTIMAINFYVLRISYFCEYYSLMLLLTWKHVLRIILLHNYNCNWTIKLNWYIVIVYKQNWQYVQLSKYLYLCKYFIFPMKGFLQKWLQKDFDIINLYLTAIIINIYVLRMAHFLWAQWPWGRVLLTPI
jgi:hypothetical protein